MDPDETLRQLRELARQVLDPAVRIQSGVEAAEQLAELFQALDEWRTKGGFDLWAPGLDLVALREDLEYDPEGDSTMDALIAYKDALEELALQHGIVRAG